MSKVVEGVALVAGAVVLGVLTGGAADVGLFGLATFLGDVAPIVGLAGISLTLSGIAQALEAGPSLPFSIRQAAAPRQVVYGQCRVTGTIVYVGTTNSGSDLNQVIVWAGHKLQSIDTVYLDARAVILSGNQDDGNQHYDVAGNAYNFKGNVHLYHNLGVVPGTYFSALGSVDTNWDSTCTLDGLASSYLKCHFDASIFPQMPAVKADVHGKADLYDPRDGTYKYTNNTALVILDVMLNNDFGLGCSLSEIDTDSFSAAANLCDEEVNLASGNVELRYTVNGYFDTTSTPGDILDALLTCCEGRLVYTNGQWSLFPAAWWGTDLDFDDNFLTANPKWSPNRKYRDLVNAVRGQYISAPYPYAISGYDQSHRDNSIFDGEWSPCDFPEYAQDALHGYSSDANLTQDGNVKLYADRSYRFVTSVSMAQRLAKIYLLRNRQQGTGTLKMNLSAYQTQPQDVITMTCRALGWTNKYLEVTSVRFVPGTSDSSSGSDDSHQTVPTLTVEFDVAQTDPSVYAWATAEERGPTNTNSPTIYNNAWTVNPPTSLVLESGLDSAVVGIDGVIQPRIHVTWTEPLDPFVTSGGYVELQWQHVGDTTWKSAGNFGATTTDYFISGVVSSQQYNVQLRAVRSNGASSAWVSAGPHTVSVLYSTITTENISGLGALATQNNVDFASGTQVLNRTAGNLTYSTGLTAEQLRPAEAGADVTAGKSLDVLVDGTYAKVQAGQLQSGYVMGKSYGANMLGNSGFENNTSNSTYGDEWSLYINNDTPGLTAFREIAGGAYHNGSSADLCLRVLPSSVLTVGAAVRVTSPRYPVAASATKGLYFGGYLSWAATAAVPAGAVIDARIGLLFMDTSSVVVGEQFIDTAVSGGATGGFTWTLKQGTCLVPDSASTVCFECSLFNVGSAVATPSGLIADVRFDDLFLYEQMDTSSALNPQGSILPLQAANLSYTVTNPSNQPKITFNWGNQTLTRPDGSNLFIQLGTFTFGPGGLSASTTYYFYPYLVDATGLLFWANSNPPSSVPDAQQAASAYLDGRDSFGVIAVTTLASGSSGSSSGTGGGASVCPEANELVDVQGKGQIKAGDVQIGDFIKGTALKTNTDVYRQVIQVNSVTSAAWRIVNGHKVSPCETVYVNGEWLPAYLVPGATIDTTVGTKMLITVQADEDQEHNYALIAGTPLLIHNVILPC